MSKTGQHWFERLINAADLSPEEIKELTKRFDPSYVPGKYKPIKSQTLSTTRRRIGLVGDTHLNSVDSNLEFLHSAYAWFKKENADFVVQTGDLTEGEEMRRDQKFGLVVQGVDRVVEYVIKNYPKTDLTTYFIGGNHDQSYFKHAGHDICKHIALYRKDMVYLGMNEGDLPHDAIGTHIKVWHPSKGTAKGLSYQTQELLDYFVNKNEKKPNILVIGHYHKLDSLFQHNVHAYQAGTTQNQTDWMRTKNLAADLTSWLLDVYYKPSGEVDHISERRLSWKGKGAEEDDS